MSGFRYSDGAKSGVPGDPASADPGPGVSGLIDVNGTSALTPLEPRPAPNATRTASVTVSFQSTADGQFLGFMNTTSFEPLNGVSTLLAVHQNPTGFVPDGVGIGTGDQLLVTADSIQVLDLRVVCVLVLVRMSPFSLTRAQRTTLTTETTHSTCTDIVPGCSYILYSRILPLL